MFSRRVRAVFDAGGKRGDKVLIMSSTSTNHEH
jgi:hypothetical protein